MVFAAGLGTRMRPVTDTIPKPLVMVGGRTMLDHMLDRLGDAGVARAVVNVHYHADQIITHLQARTRPAIAISDERGELLDQAGGIIRALPLLGPAPFLICNTDAVWIEARSNFERLASAWDDMRMDILLLVAATASSVGVDWDGDFAMADDGRLLREPQGLRPFAYAGVGIIKAGLFDGLEPKPLKLAPFFFRAAEQGRLHGVVLDGTWLHVGTPDVIGLADAALATQAG